MALIFDEFYQYRHKKFDLNKRARTESSSSNTDDSECMHMEMESLEPVTQQKSETSSTSVSSNGYNEKYNTPTAPPFKRMRTSSCSDSSHSNAYSPIPFPTLRTTSTPYNNTVSAIAPTTAILPKISDETLRNICKYHGNMVRKYPKKERTPKDQERRDKNTIACRMSRRVKKLEHVAIEEQYKEFSQQTFEIIERAMRSTAYLHALMELSSETVSAEERNLSTQMLGEEKPTTSGQDKKSFTIAYLMGNQE